MAAPTLFQTPLPAPNRARLLPPVQVDIVVPVYNEQAGLERSIRRLHRFLDAEFPFTWRIVIADNASTDDTPAIARVLARKLGGVQVLRLERKGRGRALRAAWSASDARVVAYMDVDLSTDLRALLPLVAPLLSGHSDLAIGTRLARGARVVRGPKRELISRAYNAILHTALRARFSDAQCGFKAVRREALPPLLAEVRDDAWFFDTELLVLAQRRGLRIHEVPVDWIDDPDSRVAIVRTALDDLRGVARLMSSGRIFRFMGVGVASTIAYALLYLALRGPLGAGGANAVALALTAVANTAANRRLTFGVRGRAGLVRQHLMGAARLLPHARADERRPRRPARAVREPAARRRAGGPDRGEHRRHRHPLRRAAHLGVRAPAPPRADHPLRGLGLTELQPRRLEAARPGALERRGGRGEAQPPAAPRPVGQQVAEAKAERRGLARRERDEPGREVGRRHRRRPERHRPPVGVRELEGRGAEHRRGREADRVRSPVGDLHLDPVAGRPQRGRQSHGTTFVLLSLTPRSFAPSLRMVLKLRASAWPAGLFITPPPGSRKPARRPPRE